MQKRSHQSSFRNPPAAATDLTAVPVTAILGEDCGVDAMYADEVDTVEIKEEYNVDETYQDMCLSKFDLDYKLKRSEHQHEFFFAPNENCKSDVWDRFYLIYYRGIKQDYVKCRRCFSILSYKSRTGTASLLRHNCERKHALKVYDPEIKHPIIPSIPNKSVADEAKSQIHEGQLYFLAKDLHAFDTTDRVGFQKLAQLLINFGSNFGTQPVSEVLAPTDYLVNTLMTSTITNISRIIRNFLLEEEFTLSVDISSETCSQRRFLTLSGHIIGCDYTLKTFLINTLEIDEPQEIDLKKFIILILDDYIPNSAEKLLNRLVVLDKEHVPYSSISGICEILQSSGHIVQGVLDQILANMPDEFRASLNLIKHLVQNVELGTAGSLNLYYTLKYFFEYLHNVSDPKDPNLASIDIPKLRTFYELLELFEECLADLRSEDITTIGKVYLWKIKLKNFSKTIADSDREHSILNYLKTETPLLLDEHLLLNNYHKIALFLNPNFKGLKFLTISEKQEIYDLIKAKIASIKEEDDVLFYSNNSTTTKSRSSSKPPPPKRFKDEIMFGELMDATEGDSDEESPESEIFRYVNFKLKDHCSDVLEYWRMNNDFPNLKKLARQVLNIPANVESKQSLICQGSGGSDSSSSTKSCSCAFKDNIKSLVFLNKNFGLMNSV